MPSLLFKVSYVKWVSREKADISRLSAPETIVPGDNLRQSLEHGIRLSLLLKVPMAVNSILIWV